jgi:3',5'-cyclic AMP phosphodiesterase CpdA
MGSRSFPYLGRPLLVLCALCLIPALSWAMAPFAIVADSHVGTRNSVYADIVKRIEQRNIHTIIHVGDAIDSPGNSRQWKKFLEINGSDKTLHLAPGNHDIHGDQSLRIYLRHFSKPYESLSDGDTLFVVLNTELPGEENMITGEQFTWLTSELEKPFRYKFVFLHQPLYPIVGLHGLDRREEERNRLHRLFVQKGVALVVSGHDHAFSRTAKDGVSYVIAPQTGGWLLPSFMKDGDTYGYMVVTRKGDIFSFVVLDREDRVKEQFSVTR